MVKNAEFAQKSGTCTYESGANSLLSKRVHNVNKGDGSYCDQLALNNEFSLSQILIGPMSKDPVFEVHKFRKMSQHLTQTPSLWSLAAIAESCNPKSSCPSMGKF